jgi:hypothetical protein
VGFTLGLVDEPLRRRDLPPPLWGRAGVGGSRERRRFLRDTPKPNRPPSLTLPHKGGGDRQAVDLSIDLL